MNLFLDREASGVAATNSLFICANVSHDAFLKDDFLQDKWSKRAVRLDRCTAGRGFLKAISCPMKLGPFTRA